MSQVVVITAPDVLAVSVADAKAQCRATTFTTDDDLITRLLTTAIQWLDGPQSWLGRALTPQTLELRQETFSAAGRHGYDVDIWDAYEGGSRHAIQAWSPNIKLPCGPVQAIMSVNYVDANGVVQTIDPSLYVLNGDLLSPAWGQAWPSPRGDINGVKIQYVTGYPTGAGQQPVPLTPAPICHAILMVVSHWYRNPDAVVGVENRDSSTEVPLGFASLLSQYERFV